MKYLFRAGRQTLAQSGVNSIPLFLMQLGKFPSWMHKDLDKAVRRCLWSKRDGNRSIHPLEWSTLIKSKRIGGANLRLAKEMNLALFAKYWGAECLHVQKSYGSR